MFSFIAKKTIKNHLDYSNPTVRESYGIVSSIVCILCNLLLASLKLVCGYLTNSITIQTDGFNNFSDVASNIASLVGFKSASKHPDSDHPYGHGRIEYVVGLIISIFIIFVGLSALKESFIKIMNPEVVLYSHVASFVLVISILVKLWMSYFNLVISKKIESSTLLAVSKDSLNDVYSTVVALISLILSLYTTLPVDGVLGVVVSFVVIKAGVESLKETASPLLGKAPDKELIKQLETFIMTHDEAKGIHDLMLHDYGPGSRYLTLHIEVDASSDMVEVHEVIDQIERSILEKFHILTTVHMDPIDLKDENVLAMKMIVFKIVKSIHQEYTIHDFRMVKGPTNTNLIFDVLIPAGDEIEHSLLKQRITEELHLLGYNYFTVIQIDHSFV